MEEDLDRSSATDHNSQKAASSSPPNSVHRALGGGYVADVLLWKRRDVGIYLILFSSCLWYLFEIAGYSAITLFSNVLLLLIAILFFWAKSASLLNRPLPPIPDLEVSEDFVVKNAGAARFWINYVLAMAEEIATARNFKLFFQVVSGLLLVAKIGSLFNFFTLAYIGIMLALIIPSLYERYQDQVDKNFHVARKALYNCYNKFDGSILSKIPILQSKKKKAQ